jgi:hypothetical protein
VTEKKSPLPRLDAADAATGPIITRTVHAVPWDAELLKGRDCGTCACYFEQANPENPVMVQGFCRRVPAEMQQMRVLEERRDLQGNVVMRDGKPIMQPTTAIGYLFKPTKKDGTCFDGWRALGTLPGERPIETSMRLATDRLGPLLGQIPKEVRPFLAALFGLSLEPETTHGDTDGAAQKN